MDSGAAASSVSREGGAMYAVGGIWSLDEALHDEQLRALRDEIVPRTVLCRPETRSHR